MPIYYISLERFIVHLHDDSTINKVIQLFAKLPGLGQRSARRIILELLQDPDIKLQSMINLLSQASEEITRCTQCGNLDTITPCGICTDEKRDEKLIAIVETVGDLWAIERSGFFNGKYHILGGVLSSLSQASTEDLRLKQLAVTIEQNGVQEIIIATNSTLEGQTTAFYITEYFKDQPITITRLASGIPIGGELDYLDDGTLGAALTLRKPMD